MGIGVLARVISAGHEHSEGVSESAFGAGSEAEIVGKGHAGGRHSALFLVSHGMSMHPF
jgi:hypothetical protein